MSLPKGHWKEPFIAHPDFTRDFVKLDRQYLYMAWYWGALLVAVIVLAACRVGAS